MKNSRWLCGIAAVLIGAFGFNPNLRADNPPWPPLVLVIPADADATEIGSDPAQFLVIRVGPANGPLTVDYVMGGTASNGDDYVTLPGSVTIPDGAYFASVNVIPIDDYFIEGTESVVIALQQPPVWPAPYIVVWPSVAVANIVDNDLEPTNRPPAVSLISPPDGSIFEAYDDIRLVARAFDSDGTVRTVEFFAGTNSLGVVTNLPWLTPLLDPLADPAFDLAVQAFTALGPVPGPLPAPIPGNLFHLVWSNVPPGHYILTAVATDNEGDSTRSAPIEIKVQEPTPRTIVNIRAPDPVATEPEPTTDHLDTATFTVYRRGPTNNSLRVFYRIGGTASNGVDYAELAHSIEIPAGERSADIAVLPIDDSLVEGTESIVIKLVEPPCIATFPPPPDCYSVGRADTACAVIHDNDSPNRPPLVRLVKPEDGDVFIAPAAIRLAALARDYDGYVVTVEFFEGTNSLGVVSNNPAAFSAALPPFTLLWSNVPPGRYVLHALATDNDGASTRSRPVEIKVVPRIEPPIVNIVATDPEAAEPGVPDVINPAVFSVTRTGGTNSPLLVFYRVDGTAENGVDYQFLPGRVQIPAGASSARIIVNPIDDQLVEGLETVVVKLETYPLITPTNTAPEWWYRIGSNDIARAVIRDNDFPPTNYPPRVKIVQPDDGDLFRAPTDIKLAAAAHDPDGWVKTVEFFADNISIGIASNSFSSSGGIGAPDNTGLSPEQLFLLLWHNVPPGPHVLLAKATDNQGASSFSDPVRIKVLPPACPPVITIYATDPYASECDWLDLLSARSLESDASASLLASIPNTASFTVGRSGCVDNDLVVYYRLEGTAKNGADYRQLPGKVLIPRGSYRARIIVDPIDDLLPEPTETVIATLIPQVCIATYPPPPDCYRVGDPNRAVAYIFDNDFNQSAKVEIVHPQDGDIFRAGSDIKIDVATLDPDGWVSKVEFFANHTKIGEQEIFFIVPPPPGQLQRFSMTWSNVPIGDYLLLARATDNRGGMSLSDPVRIKVVAIPPLPIVTIEAIDPIASEPNPILPAIDSARFQVTRHDADLSRPLTVHYRIAGTASNGLDYVSLLGVITIPSNSPTATVEVVPRHDTLVEGTESVILALLQPPCVISNAITPDCYLVGEPGRDIVYIRDNDVPNKPPTVAIVSPPNGAVFSAPLDLRLVAAAADPDGWVTTVEFFDGDKSLGIVRNPITILDAAPVRLSTPDTDVLAANTLTRPFVLVWSNVPPGKHILTAIATDNTGDKTRSLPIEIAVRASTDLPIVRITAPDAVAREGTSNTAIFRIRRTGPTNSPLTVFYSIGGTATNGVDYLTIPGSLTIPAGRYGARLVITPIDDKLDEPIETVRLRLVSPPFSPTTYEIGRPARAAAVILDNDYLLLSPELLVDGIHLRLLAFEGMPFRLESSTDLSVWMEEASDISVEDGISVVEESGEFPRRFFRILPEYGDLEKD
jgi:hypothetical protein